MYSESQIRKLIFEYLLTLEIPAITAGIMAAAAATEYTRAKQGRS